MGYSAGSNPSRGIEFYGSPGAYIGGCVVRNVTCIYCDTFRLNTLVARQRDGYEVAVFPIGDVLAYYR
jgi:hypothetical protein